MKNPNGYGTVTKLKGKRRKPYVVREGRSGKQKLIGTTATREKGLILIARYNSDPWEIENGRVTLQKLFEMWREKKAVRLGNANKRALFSAYRYCEKYANIRYNALRAFHMQDTIDTCGLSYATQSAIKNLWGHLDRFALELDVISKRYSVLLTSAPVPETTKEVFSDDEISLLWKNQETPWVDSVLFFLYTGFRISEMLQLKVCSVDLSKEIITGGANKVCIDRIMGHKSKGTGERVYTNKNIEELRANIELIKN